MTEDLVARALLAVVMIASGILALWLSRATASGRVRRNQIAGIRTRATLASDAAWLAAHRRAQPLTAAAGWCAIAAGSVALVPVPMPAVVVAVLVGAIAMIVLTLCAAAVGGRAARDADAA